MAIKHPTNAEIEQLDAQIEELTMKRNKLSSDLYHTWLASVDSLPDEARDVYLFISENPGCGRKELASSLPQIAEQMPRVLTILRRNRGMIENRGTRSKPEWHTV